MIRCIDGRPEMDCNPCAERGTACERALIALNTDGTAKVGSTYGGYWGDKQLGTGFWTLSNAAATNELVTQSRRMAERSLERIPGTSVTSEYDACGDIVTCATVEKETVTACAVRRNCA